MFSCSDEPLEYVSQEIIEGKISAIEPGCVGRSPILPVIYIQNEKITRPVSIPFSYLDRWDVGDSCLLIIEKYKIKKNDK
jgi:hypothetical protein